MRFALPAKLPQGFSHGLLILLEPLRWEPQALFAMPGKIKSKIKIKSDKVCLAGPLRQKNKDPRQAFARQGPKLGMGVRHALFPGPAFGAQRAAGFPTLFSTASGIAAS